MKAIAHDRTAGHLALLVLLFGIAATACTQSTAADTAKALAEQPLVADVAKGYKSYRRITKNPVPANPELVVMCSSATPVGVAEARQRTGPHTTANLLIYMNDVAARDFAAQSKTYSVGAVIVKQKELWVSLPANLQPSAQQRIEGAGGMIKRAAGYDPAHGDWEYFYFENPATIDSGRIDSCVRCHTGAKATDYVFGQWAEKHSPDK